VRGFPGETTAGPNGPFEVHHNAALKRRSSTVLPAPCNSFSRSFDLSGGPLGFAIAGQPRRLCLRMSGLGLKEPILFLQPTF